MRTRHRVAAPLAALCVAGATAVPSAAAQATAQHHHRTPTAHHRVRSGSTGLPEKKLEAALQLQATKINGDLSFSVERTDITNVTLNGTPILPSFQINGELDFQPLGHGKAFMNGDLALKPGELDPVIATALKDGLTVQAEHQHMYDFSPMVWFVHLRAKGDPVTIARALHDVLAQTSTPLPQTSPSHPTTPFDVQRLKRILHGYDAQVGSNGVVTVYVSRRNPIMIDGVRVNPATNIATNIAFEPLTADGSQAAVIPDFGMTGKEVNGVLRTMQGQGWDIGCLYNQETQEHPQLYFSHEFKTGNPYQLAQEVRNGLNQTNSH